MGWFQTIYFNLNFWKYLILNCILDLVLNNNNFFKNMLNCNNDILRIAFSQVLHWCWKNVGLFFNKWLKSFFVLHLLEILWFITFNLILEIWILILFLIIIQRQILFIIFLLCAYNLICLHIFILSIWINHLIYINKYLIFLFQQFFFILIYIIR